MRQYFTARTMTVVLLLLFLFSIDICFGGNHYQPLTDIHYQKDLRTIKETIGLDEEQADYEVRLLRALEIKGLRSLNPDGFSSGSFTLVDIDGIEYSLTYSTGGAYNGIESLTREAKEGEEFEKIILYFGPQTRQHLPEVDWVYYGLGDET